ncbi:MAG TPA: Lrp/AsnC family transcriptional regulator, partial [Methanosarcinales archaeon]|nr:Lrp/AsnC family transcriptional regulator [Methanosarcinales archaeon]
MEEIEGQVLKLICHSRDGVLQSRIWKEMGINSRQCSRIIRKLLDEGLV